MITGISATGTNDLLAALPERERLQLEKHGEIVALKRDAILGEPGEPIRHVYFPLDGFISLVAQADSHDSLGMALIGTEGMLGTSLILGVETSSLRARSEANGSALCIAAADFVDLLVETPVLERQMRLYLYRLLTQVAQTGACAAFHVVEVRLAYWLLMAHDRAHGERFYMTHALIASLLGVRRSGVTTAAGVLHRRKLINYARGHIVVLDRAGLEAAACGCYEAMRGAFDLASPEDTRKPEPVRAKLRSRPRAPASTPAELHFAAPTV